MWFEVFYILLYIRVNKFFLLNFYPDFIVDFEVRLTYGSGKPTQLPHPLSRGQNATLVSEVG